jgi:hypothetical protein
MLTSSGRRSRGRLLVTSQYLRHGEASVSIFQRLRVNVYGETIRHPQKYKFYRLTLILLLVSNATYFNRNPS